MLWGGGNKLKINGLSLKNRIQINGSNNVIMIEDEALLMKSLVKISGHNNRVILHRNSYVSGAELWVEDNDCTIEIGQDAFIGHHSHLACTEDGRSIIVGNGTMISSYVQIRTGDSHSLMDEDGKRYNKAASVSIGDHCWIGEGAKVLKGVALSKDTVVGTGAIVTKSFKSGVLLGGIPAKVLKENVIWDENRI